MDGWMDGWMEKYFSKGRPFKNVFFEKHNYMVVHLMFHY
jgi:hypothetical protein